MPDAFLDSSVLIGLHFRHAGERAACKHCLPQGAGQVSSRYVIFEIARGFLRSLILLHNASFEYARFSDLHMAAYSGQRRFRHYEMHTWLGAMTDFQALLEQEIGPFEESQKLELLRAKLRVIVQRGWRKLQKSCRVINEVSCRRDLPEPSLNGGGRLVQALPVSECGKPNACGLQHYIEQHHSTVEVLAAHLESLPVSSRGNDTGKHITGLRHLLESPVGREFNGRMCHQCGDAIICMEAPQGHVIATKNRRDFQPIADHLGKPWVVAITAATTESQHPPA